MGYERGSSFIMILIREGRRCLLILVFGARIGGVDGKAWLCLCFCQHTHTYTHTQTHTCHTTAVAHTTHLLFRCGCSWRCCGSRMCFVGLFQTTQPLQRTLVALLGER